jgi:hypothetical protein
LLFHAITNTEYIVYDLVKFSIFFPFLVAILSTDHFHFRYELKEIKVPFLN